MRGSRTDFPKIHPNNLPRPLLAKRNLIPPLTGFKLTYNGTQLYPKSSLANVLKAGCFSPHHHFFLFFFLSFMIDEKASLDKQMLDKLIWKMSRVDLCKHFTNVINLQQCQTKPLLDWAAQWMCCSDLLFNFFFSSTSTKGRLSCGPCLCSVGFQA